MNFNTARRIILTAVCLLAAITASSSSGVRPSSARQTFSQIHPPSASETAVTYRSFVTGTSYQLKAYDGKYVRLALPDSWLPPAGLTREEIDLLVDTTDLTYAHLAELVGGEPSGEGLQTVAVVPVRGSDGVGVIGGKGVEISPTQLPRVLSRLRLGLPSDGVLHEMAHNLDPFSVYICSGPDTPHAWTTFMIPYTLHYARWGTTDVSPDDILEQKIVEYTAAWDALGPSASWERCVRDAACNGVRPNDAWAGFMLRFAKLHGPSAVKRAFSFLRAYKSQHPVPPATPEGRNDLLFKALAFGAQTDIACELVAWHWSASDEAKSSVAAQFPSPNYLCADADADGYSAVTGDTDDADGSVSPGAAEVVNRRDDDGNGIIDDLPVTETADFPAEARSAPTFTAPSRIRGIAERGGTDTVVLDLAAAGILKVRLLKGTSFHGWVELKRVGAGGEKQSFYSLTSASHGFEIDTPGAWALTLTPDAGLWAADIGGSGSYDFTVESPSTLDDGVTMTTAPQGDGSWRITASSQAIRPPTTARLWLTGSGFVSEQSLAGGPAIFTWTPTLESHVTAGIRAQILSSGSPTTPTSPSSFVLSDSGETTFYATDLAIKATTLPVEPTSRGSELIYGLTIKNNGPATARGVSVSFSLDGRLTLTSLDSTAGSTAVSVAITSVSVPALHPGGVFFVNLKGFSTAAGVSLTSAVTVSALNAETDSSNNSASVTTRVASELPTPTPTATPTATPRLNPIDHTTFFVRQHYLDFLGREPDADGLTFWTNEIEQCGTDLQCREAKRVNVSAAFFLSIEFQQTGYLVERIHKVAYGDPMEASTGLTVPILTREEFLHDTPLISSGVVVNTPGWQQKLEINKSAYTQTFVQRPRFKESYSDLTPAQFLDRLDANAGRVLTPPERASLTDELTANYTTAGRASVLLRVAENAEFGRLEKNRAFVLMQYFGYLRRNPSDAPEAGLNYAGWNFWLGKLNQFDGNFVQAEMVKAFLVCAEFRQRFGS